MTYLLCCICENKTYILDKLSSELETFKFKRFKNIHTELHFNKESFTTKRLFFKLLRKYDFKIYYYQTTYLDKNLNYDAYIIKSIEENISIFKDSKFYIDGDISKKYGLIKKIKDIFKINKIKVKSIKFINSKNSISIQISDMCAGCIRRKLDRGNKEDLELFYLIQKFIK